MNQTFWMARSQTHNDHDAKVISRLFSFFYPNYHFYPLFLVKPEVEPGFCRDQFFAVVSEKFRRLFESSTRGHTSIILWAIENNILLKNAIFSLFWRKKNMNCQVYGRTTPLCHSASSQRRDRFIITISRREIIVKKIVKIIKIIN